MLILKFLACVYRFFPQKVSKIERILLRLDVRRHVCTRGVRNAYYLNGNRLSQADRSIGK